MLIATFALLVTSLWMLVAVCAVGLVTTALYRFLLAASLSFLVVIA